MIIPFSHSRRKARIEIIPLIDVVFFLLASFVMVSLSMVKNKGVNVNLPKAVTGARQAEANDYTVITVTRDGEIYLNKARVSLPDLARRLKELKAGNPDPSLLLNGDDKAALGRAVEVLDEARKLGIKKVAIQTRDA